MSRRIVMRMLPDVSGELGVHNPAERHKPEREASDGTLSNSRAHKLLSKRYCLFRPLFLNPCDRVVDLLFSQQPALDIFLHAAFLIDEDADG